MEQADKESKDISKFFSDIKTKLSVRKIRANRELNHLKSMMDDIYNGNISYDDRDIDSLINAAIEYKKYYMEYQVYRNFAREIFRCAGPEYMDWFNENHMEV